MPTILNSCWWFCLKAVILAGGLGKRFGIAKKILSKSLAPIGGIPLLKAVINDFVANPEVDEIIVLAGHNRQIRNFVNWTRFGKPVIVSNVNRGVFGDLLSVQNRIGNEPFFVGSADNLVLGHFPTREQFEKSGAWMVTAVAKMTKPKEFTGIDFEGEKVVRVDESDRQSASGYGIVGKKLFSPRIWDFIKRHSYGRRAGIGTLTQQLFNEGKKIVPIPVPSENVIHITSFWDWWQKRKRNDLLHATWLAAKSRFPKRKPRKPRANPVHK